MLEQLPNPKTSLKKGEDVEMTPDGTAYSKQVVPAALALPGW